MPQRLCVHPTVFEIQYKHDGQIIMAESPLCFKWYYDFYPDGSQLLTTTYKMDSDDQMSSGDLGRKWNSWWNTTVSTKCQVTSLSLGARLRCV